MCYLLIFFLKVSIPKVNSNHLEINLLQPIPPHLFVPAYQTPCQISLFVHFLLEMFVKCQINATFAVRFPKGLPRRSETQLLNTN